MFLVFDSLHLKKVTRPGYVNSLLLKMTIEIVDFPDFPIKNGGSFHSYVNLPEATHCSLQVV